MFYGVLDGFCLHYINTGHPPPLLVRGASGEITELATSGLPLGVRKEIRLEEFSIAIEPNDVVMFYTDGITEARNDSGEFFGGDRL